MKNGVSAKFSCKTERLSEDRRLDEGTREGGGEMQGLLRDQGDSG